MGSTINRTYPQGMPDGPETPISVQGRPGVQVLRGIRRRCGRCGGKGVMRGWFHMRDRCEHCGYQFKREEGFFTGVMLVNLGITLAVLFGLMMAWILWRVGQDNDPSIRPIMLAAVAIGVIIPIVAYPVASTTWAAMDLAMRPLDDDEVAAADQALRAEGH